MSGQEVFPALPDPQPQLCLPLPLHPSPVCTRCTRWEVPARGERLQYEAVKYLFLGGRLHI